MTGRLAATLVLLSFFAACTTAEVVPIIFEPVAPPVPDLDPDRVSAGQSIYLQNCAACHGVDLAGQKDWKVRDKEGFLPAPPQDSAGHTWHHSDQLIMEIVRDGLDVGPTRMPKFGSQLSDEEISAVIEFIKSTWGERERAFQWEVSWRETQRAS